MATKKELPKVFTCEGQSQRLMDRKIAANGPGYEMGEMFAVGGKYFCTEQLA